MHRDDLVGLLVQPFADLADRDTLVEQSQYPFDARDIQLAVEAVSLGGTLGPDQLIASFPGP